MQVPHSNRKAAPSKALKGLLTQIVIAGPGAVLAALYRLLREARRKSPGLACTYCGSGLHDDGHNCTNCGAPSPPPPPEPVVTGPSTTVWVATLALWSMGGFAGLHCHAARRHWRGLIYLAGFFCIFFVATSYDITAPGPAFNGQAILWIGIALTLLWAYDGVQIIRGRFIR